MSRIDASKAARIIISDMVSDKAEVKRKKLFDDLRVVDAEIEASCNKRTEAARKDIEAAFTAAFKSKIGHILAKYEFGGVVVEYSKQSGKCCYRFVGDEGRKRRIAIERELKDLDERAKRARQETILRASLGTKYDEVISTIDNLQF